MRWPLSMKKWSMAGWASLWLVVIGLTGIAAHFLARQLIEAEWLAVILAMLAVVPLAAWSVRWLTR